MARNLMEQAVKDAGLHAEIFIDNPEVEGFAEHLVNACFALMKNNPNIDDSGKLLDLLYEETIE